MTAQEPVPFHKLGTADLVVDRLFDGGLQGQTSDDPIAQLLPVGNQGGFRYKGSPERGSVQLVVLHTTGTEPDWPDSLDLQTGIFTYYGDNKRPGHELHDICRKGNLLLKSVFELTNGTAEDRLQVPSFLLFEKTGPGRRVAFRGLLAPGAASLTSDDELTAIWRSSGGSRFQNYRSRFTVLDAPEVSRAWIDDILAGKTNASIHRPDSWTAWVDGRNCRSLTAPPTTTVRSREDQLPDDASGCEILNTIRNHYRGNEHAFETCASEIWRLTAPRTTHCELTRPAVDGGRDAIGIRNRPSVRPDHDQVRA